mmetsp:Transcript_168728/g.542232  ORF Transcript_168728/g.542232 Transcript_168728/m.542232 type:complete len:247 (+) Transcript_168728:232-972(+)
MPPGSTELETEQVLEIIRILPHELVFRPQTVPKDVKSATQRNIREPLDGSGAADRSTFDGSFQNPLRPCSGGRRGHRRREPGPCLSESRHRCSSLSHSSGRLRRRRERGSRSGTIRLNLTDRHLQLLRAVAESRTERHGILEHVSVDLVMVLPRVGPKARQQQPLKGFRLSRVHLRERPRQLHPPPGKVHALLRATPRGGRSTPTKGPTLGGRGTQQGGVCPFLDVQLVGAICILAADSGRQPLGH